MNSNKKVVAEFEDKFGEKRQIHHTQHGLRVKQKRVTLIHGLNPIIAKITGERIRKYRERAGLTMKELCIKAGIESATPKNRMWELEKGVRGHGMRFGTLYAIAMALEVEPWVLLPTIKELKEIADIDVLPEYKVQSK